MAGIRHNPPEAPRPRQVGRMAKRVPTLAPHVESCAYSLDGGRRGTPPDASNTARDTPTHEVVMLRRNRDAVRASKAWLRWMRRCGLGCSVPSMWPRADRRKSRHVASVAGAIFDQILHHRWIGEGRSIAERIDFIGRDLAQDTPHDLAGPCLRQGRRPLDNVR